eukprot:3905906-Amphidinium_carterae.1
MDVSRADSMSFEHVEGVLLDALSDLPVWPLRIICENEEGRTVPIQLNYKPLGISYETPDKLEPPKK